jgi:hypothetical protein
MEGKGNRLTVTLLCVLAALGSAVAAGSFCGSFLPGAACIPNGGDKIIITNASEAECRGGCEAQNEKGCCWHSPATLECEWAPGVPALYYGGPDVRSAANCSAGPPVTPTPSPRAAPEGIHLAYGEAASTMVFSWSTLDGPPSPDGPQAVLVYAADATSPPVKVAANSTTGGNTSPHVAIHVATVTGLTPGATYTYHVGWATAPAMNSPPATFTAKQDSLDWAPRLAVFGDLGWTNGQIVSNLRDESVAGTVDAVLLWGDMVYWWNTAPAGLPGNGDHFFRDVASMTGAGAHSVPIHVSPGNGDAGANFSEYRSRWFMPGWDSPMEQPSALMAGQGDPVRSLWHSFNVGRAHIIGINSEAMGYNSRDNGGNWPRMLRWLTADLAAAQAARALRPWILLHIHRYPPLRTLAPLPALHPASASAHSRLSPCRPPYSSDGSEARGSQAANYAVLEALLDRHGVDLIFSGHVHHMERTLPLRNFTAVPSPDPQRPYHDARAPVYVVSGAVGCAEEHDPFSEPWHEWTAWRSMAYGYSHLTVINSTHLELDFQSDNLGGRVIDAVMVTKSPGRLCNFGAECAVPGRGDQAQTQTQTQTQAQAETAARMLALAAARSVTLERLRRCWGEAAGGGGRRGEAPCGLAVSAAAAAAGGEQERSAPPTSAARAALNTTLVPADQRALLVQLHQMLGGANWTYSANWLSGDPCDAGLPWYGVSCNRVTDATLPELGAGAPYGVTALQLGANNLVSTKGLPEGLPAAMGPSLQLLDLCDNFIGGPLPAALFSMPLLHSLFLAGRGLGFDGGLTMQGHFPDPVCTKHLKYLHMQRQNYSGSIPASIGRCSGLNQIMLFSNALTGEVPQEVAVLPLHTIYMQHNNFSCPFPCLHQYSPYANFDCGTCPKPASASCYPCG